MLNIKIIGADSINSRRIEESILSVADSMDLQVEVTHVADTQGIAKWDVHGLPALVVNDHLMCAGRIPMDEEVASYLLSQPA